MPRLLGTSGKNSWDRRIETLMPERFRGRHPEYRSQFRAQPRVRPMGGFRGQLRLMHSAGGMLSPAAARSYPTIEKTDRWTAILGDCVGLV